MSILKFSLTKLTDATLNVHRFQQSTLIISLRKGLFDYVPLDTFMRTNLPSAMRAELLRTTAMGVLVRKKKNCNPHPIPSRM